MLTLTLYHYIIMTRFTVSVYAVFTYLIEPSTSLTACPQMFTSLLICVLKVHKKSSNAQLYFNNAFHGIS